jgi:hypothetical protein
MSNLPANISNMVTGLAASVQVTGTGAGDMFMKMSKGGIFVYGVENIETEEDALWAVNPAGFLHGWTAWGDKTHGTAGKNLGEKIGPAAQPIFAEGDLPEVQGSWSQCVGIQLRCMDGEDEGTQCLFKSNSLGGRKGYAALLGAVVAKIQSGDPAFVPVVKLESDSYKHEEYGQIFNPLFVIQSWTTMDAEEEEEEEEEQEEVASDPEPTPKAKRAKKANKETAEEVVAEPEQPRRRRRKKAA